MLNTKIPAPSNLSRLVASYRHDILKLGSDHLIPTELPLHLRAKMTQFPHTDQNHYEILDLPRPQYHKQANINANADPTSRSSPETIKLAYRAALLKHHPDKNKNSGSSTTGTNLSPSATVDAIKLAYLTLSNPSTRHAYDLSLLTAKPSSASPNSPMSARPPSHFIGEETLDLDDLAYDDVRGEWYRACRCGQERGFAVNEGELEEEMEKGGREVVVGCRGCSLWVRVGFGVVDDEDEDDGEKEGDGEGERKDAQRNGR